MSPRALVVVLTDNPGGAERVACSVASALAALGWQVDFHVVCRGSRGFIRNATRPEVCVTYGAASRERLAFPLYPLRVVGRRYDLVFSTHVHTNALMSVLRKLRIVGIGRLVTRESTTVFDRFAGAKGAMFRALYRMYGSQDLIVAQTAYMASHIAPYLPGAAGKRLRVLPNPLDLAAIDRSAEEPLPAPVAQALSGRENILFCGRLIEVKQPILALQAYARAVAAGCPDDRPRLIFMGDGPLRPALEAASREAGLAEDDVIFLGRQSNPYAVMRRCRYGILTSSREGFPNVVLEMMATGVRKIVVTPCAGDLEVLTGVTITPDFQADSVAEALERAIASGEDRREDYRRVVAARSIDAFVNDMLAKVGIFEPQPLQTVE